MNAALTLIEAKNLGLSQRGQTRLRGFCDNAPEELVLNLLSKFWGTSLDTVEGFSKNNSLKT